MKKRENLQYIGKLQEECDMFKRFMGLAMVSVLTFTTLAGCGGKAASEPAGGDGTTAQANAGESGNKTAGSGEKVTIKFWDGNWSEPRFQEIKKLWDEQHPNIELVAEFQVDDGMSEIGRAHV